MNEFQLVLVDPNPEFCVLLHESFRGLPGVGIVAGRFEQLPEFDCMVSAANSFGLMDGGVDAAIIRFFGGALMERVQRHILDEYRGEQNVGTSFVVETGHPRHPFVAHTPTMRVPMEIARTDNVYRAMWAMLLAIRQHNRQSNQPISLVACPGLGTGTGQVPFAEAARQMSMAYGNFLHPTSDIDWGFASRRQQQIRYGGDFGLHVPPVTGTTP